MPIKLNSSGGGSVTIDVPSTASAFTLTAPAASANLLTSSSQSIPKAALPTGSVLQIVQFEDNVHRSWSGTGRSSLFVVPGPFGDGTMFITRISNTSKILVDVRLLTGCDNDSWCSFVMQYAPEGSNYSNFPTIGVSGGTSITKTGCLAHFGGSSGGGSQSDTQYRLHPAPYQYLLDPSTSQNKVFVRIQTSYGHDGASRTLYLNRPSNASDNNRYTGNSVVTLREIAA
jgi:hypothetical protein